MIRHYVLLLVCFACTGPLARAAEEGPKPGAQVAQSAKLKVGTGDDAREVTMRYWLFVPSNEGLPAEKKWPLLLFLHGSGERGDDLEAVKKHGPPKILAENTDFPMIAVSPQCPADKRWDAAELGALLDHVEKTLPVDKDRLYVTGLSMGGAGTWSLIAAQPDRFAAAVPICGGGGGEVTSERVALLSKLPIWAYYGDQDRPQGLEQCQEIIAALEKAGNKNAKMTVYPNVGHDSWTQTYGSPQVYNWLLGFQRGK